MKVLIQHDNAAHPGYCCGEMCQIRSSGQVVRQNILSLKATCIIKLIENIEEGPVSELLILTVAFYE